MFRSTAAFCVPILLAVLAGPLSFALGSKAIPDESNLYIVVGSTRTLDGILAEPEIREIGPSRAPFARLVYTSSSFHASLVAQGYWTFPATRLAELCGVQLDT